MNPEEPNERSSTSFDGVFPHDQHQQHHHMPPSPEPIHAPDPTGHHTLPEGDDEPVMGPVANFSAPVEPPRQSEMPSAPTNLGVSSTGMKHGHNFGAMMPSHLMKKPIGKTKHYMVEYILSFWTLGATLGSLITLMNAVIDHNHKIQVTSTYSYVTNSLMYPLTVAAISGIIVTLPLYIFLSSRTRKYELAHPEVWTHRWQRIVYNLALVVVALFSIGYFMALVYSVVAAVIGAGLPGTDSKLTLAGILKQLFALFLFVITLFFYAKQKPEAKE